MKWMMGWMHDTLKYFKEDPVNRKYHHNKLTFASMYMYKENYMMPLSHDEVVHGKASLIYKMVGDEWQKFANLRALYTYMFTHPGAKLLFMGGEFGQTNEWNFTRSLDWHLLEYPIHKGLQDYVKDLLHLYKSETSLYENQFNHYGFDWVEANDGNNSIYIYLRKGKTEDDVTMTVLNLTPRVFDYKIGVDEVTSWEVILNSDDKKYGGSGVMAEIVDEEDDEWMYRPNAVVLRLPPLAGVVLKQKKTKKTKPKKSSKTEATLDGQIHLKVPGKKTTAKKSATAKKEPIVSASAVTSPNKESKVTAKSVASKKVAAPKKTAMTTKKVVKSKTEATESIISAEVVSGTKGEAKIDSKALSKETKPATRTKPANAKVTRKAEAEPKVSKLKKAADDAKKEI